MCVSRYPNQFCYHEVTEPQIEQSAKFPSQVAILSKKISAHSSNLQTSEANSARAIEEQKLKLKRMTEDFSTRIEEQSVRGCSSILTQIGGAFLPRHHARPSTRHAAATTGSTDSIGPSAAHRSPARSDQHRSTRSKVGPRRRHHFLSSDLYVA